MQADIEKMDATGFAPLHHACEQGHEESVKSLLVRGLWMELQRMLSSTPQWRVTTGYESIQQQSGKEQETRTAG